MLIDVDQAKESLVLRRADPPRPLVVGDHFSINDHEAIVAGSFRSTPEYFLEPAVYTTYSRALSFAPPERKVMSFALVKVKPGGDVAAVAGRINRLGGLKALTSDEFERQTMGYVLKKTGILINFGMTILLGVVIGILIAAQTLYGFVLDHLRHFAALKAMGASNGLIVRMVTIQVGAVGLIGYGIGPHAACISGTVFSRVGLAFQMPWQVPVVGAVAICFCCLTAAAVSLARVLRLEPAMVF